MPKQDTKYTVCAIQLVFLFFYYPACTIKFLQLTSLNHRICGNAVFFFYHMTWKCGGPLEHKMNVRVVDWATEWRFRDRLTSCWWHINRSLRRPASTDELTFFPPDGRPLPDVRMGVNSAVGSWFCTSQLGLTLTGQDGRNSDPSALQRGAGRCWPDHR